MDHPIVQLNENMIHTGMKKMKYWYEKKNEILENKIRHNKNNLALPVVGNLPGPARHIVDHPGVHGNAVVPHDVLNRREVIQEINIAIFITSPKVKTFFFSLFIC